MIANGSSNGCVWWWAQHLQSEENEKARIVQTYGLRSKTVEGMLNEMMDFAVGTPCTNPFYQLNLSPAPGECLTEKEWDRAREIAEEKHGLKGQPYFMVMHTKHGEEHIHLIHGRIDLETGKTISDSYDARKNHAIARQIERELGLQKVIGPYDLEPGMPRPKRAPKRYESLRAFKSGLALADIEAEVTELRQQSQNGQEFKAALARHGYILAHGDKVVAGQITLMIIDTAGNDHSLARRLHVPSMEVNAFMRDVDVKSLPDIREAKALQRERKIEGLEADRATVRDEIQWQEALDRAAIAKEEKQRQFVEPKEREKEETRARREQKQPGDREEKVWPVNPPTPERKSPRLFEQAATEATRDDRTENLKGTAAHVWAAWQQSDNAQAFAAALDDKGIAFAAVTGEEAYTSHREADFARAIGNYAMRFKEGEIVIVTEPRPEHRRDGAIIEPPRVHKLDQSLAEKFVAALDNRKQLQGIDATLKVSDKRAQQRAADREATGLERATDLRDFSRAMPAKAIDGILKTAKIADNVLGGIGAGVHAVADAVDSLLSVKLTPEQIREGEITQQRREAEAEATLDYSRYTADTTQQRRQEEIDREAEGQRQRDGGGRDR